MEMIMGNSYFKFKQFTIHQDKCAMKVCTDACIFGAWSARHFSHAVRILDIGSGTGLLMMMMAQQSQGSIDGIELVAGCHEQLIENISQNNWKERLHAYHGDVKKFEAGQQYDLIISNPPFFEGDLKSDCNAEQLAKHSKELTLQELFQSVLKFISSEGSFNILIPYHRYEETIRLASQSDLNLQRELLVRQTEKHSFFRAILSFSTHSRSCITEELTIKENGQYTAAFIDLLKDYYLYL
jgi:tRNA1Val (adenine37-N6)-methyltransferase